MREAEDRKARLGILVLIGILAALVAFAFAFFRSGDVFSAAIVVTFIACCLATDSEKEWLIAALAILLWALVLYRGWVHLL
jgi:hypothetical protein